jgi:hypothetical protein
MALRDEITQKQNKIGDLVTWVNKQKNRKEWLDIILDESFSNQAVAALLSKHGFKTDWNVVYRYRMRHGSK